jgi:hypothetical protein
MLLGLAIVTTHLVSTAIFDTGAFPSLIIASVVFFPTLAIAMDVFDE